MQLTFVTSNHNKLFSAQTICADFGIKLTQATFDIPELQAEDGALIARDKAQKAYDILQKPLVVTDDSWDIVGLRGFPGPYMKSMKHWFRLEDWQRLTSALPDRRVILHQYLVFQDETRQQLLHVAIEGTILKTPRGNPSEEPWTCFASLSNNETIAEARDAGRSALEDLASVWHEFGQWAKKNVRPPQS
jgi:XTP/dITP diphosphohydrolase